MNAYAPSPGGAIARAAAKTQPDVRLSFEFFPPKNEQMEARLWESVAKLAPLDPDYVSVTYGAGGSTRERTHRTIEKILGDTNLKVAAHLTCVAADRASVDSVIQDYWELGVRHIVALRGDPPEGIGARYTPHPEGYPYASDLVSAIKRLGDFKVSVSAYPEKHPGSPDWRSEIDNLKRKVDAGADEAITQFFFDPEAFFRFVDRVRDAGLSVPIVPGVMPVSNYAGLKRMADATGASVPAWMESLFGGLDDDPKTRELVAACAAAELCAQLVEEGFRQIHIYTLNRSELAAAVARVLGLRPKTASQGDI